MAISVDAHGPAPLPLLFIDTRIQRVGADVDVLATLDSEPVLVRQGNITGNIPPELTTDLRLHRAAFSSF